MTSYPTAAFRRPALAPGLLGAIVLLAGLALLDNETWFLVIRFLVAILALILVVFSYQAKHWWWIPLLLAMAVVWNPVFPFLFHGQIWVAAQLVAALAFVAVGILVKVLNPDDKNAKKTVGRR
ncbi:DUF6804 family protein [Lacisediminihabitans changchengi]|uniref:Uncharacterized protein n=1 Tax=Lacisediminihabitans changchengi TaxID=2787634 RepID=A0A934W352_9MICO|nr:DUF6804 family protein [Lacisediminihabitans changchengi]MBK4347551.1 hypothetical protein [Lacisediminihabitans changchengi]